MRRRKSFETTTEEDSLLNLTPLIDVVFVVLIIFILIAPMLEVDKISLAEGTKETKELTGQNQSPITLQVRSDDSIWINSRQITLEQLHAILLREKAAHPDKVPQLLQDKKATFGTYQSIKNAVEIAGFSELDVVLQPGSSL